LKESSRIEYACELSPMQEGMLFHSLLSEQTCVYIQQVLAHFNHELNVIAFEQAWQIIIERHDIFRMSINRDDSQRPLQNFHSLVELPLQQQDWSGLLPSEQNKRLNAYLQSDRTKGFAVDKAPLMRLALFKLGAADYRCIWTYHHVLLDGRSRVLVLKELFALYEALNRGSSIELKPARHYRDYISWLQTQDLSKAEAFWKNLLEGFFTPTQLAIARPSMSVSSETEHAEMWVRLSRDLTSTLLDVARHNEFTLNTIIQGAWALLLSRYSNQDDVVFGATRACRNSVPGEPDTMVGLFINTVPVRIQLSHGDLVIPWLKALRSQHIAVRDCEHTPLVLIQSWNQLPRGTSLFESVVVFENHSLDSVMKSLGGEWEKREFSVYRLANYPLMLGAFLESELLIRLEYDRNRFSEQMMARLLQDLQTLLRSIAEDPDRKVIDLRILSAEQRHQILVEYNDTSRDYPRDSLIHEQFENQSSLAPDCTAVVFGEEHLSYAQLNARANRLAHYLKDLGAGPEEIVGVCLDRSIELAVSILAVLKSGASYLPLDLTYPAQRLAFMLEDSGVKIVLSRQHMKSITLQPNIRQVDIKAEDTEIKNRSEENTVRVADKDNSAYVIYTSGSTGKPKGVVICHKSAVNLLTGLRESIYRSLPPGQLRVSLNGPIAFDTSVKQMIQLLAGHTLHIISEQIREDPEHLLAYINSQSLDVFDCTPSGLDLLINCGLLTQERRPALILVGGEQINQGTWQLLASAEKNPFYNVYGPTECTVNATTHHITESAETSIIGRPITNVRLYLLDRLLRPTPKGVMGELYIAGEAVGRGYLGRLGLTAEKFLPDIYSNRPGERMYRTGDLCRYRENGQIEYLTRNDGLVKLRGYRIELGEIEEILNSYDTVKKSVVVVCGDTNADKRLVAYVASEGDNPALMVTELRCHLRQKLPEFMMPSAFVMMASLPLTANGKVDRCALTKSSSAVRFDERNHEHDFVAPRNPTEELVAGIWADILGLNQVGVFDNFFESGGHSLKANQIASRLRSAFNIDLPLSTVFEISTVAGLAEAIEIAVREKQGMAAPPIVPTGREIPIPLSFSQQRLWILDQLDPGGTAYNSSFALRLAGSLSAPALDASINQIIRRHESLRTCIGKCDGIPLQIISAPVRVVFPLVNLKKISSDKREALALRMIVQQARIPLDLQRGPLIHAALIRLDDTDHVLMLIIHHIVFDGWSFSVFIQELATLYEAYLAGVRPRLPELTIQYADYSHWQRQWLKGETFEKQVNYWKQQLENNTRLNLPVAYTTAATGMLEGDRQAIIMPASLAEALKELSRREGVTLFMTLLAAFQVLLSRWTGQEDISVGTPIAGRNRQELEGLIGFFVNTLVLRTNLSGDPSVTELLRRVRKVALDAYTHQDVPFERVVQALKPRRDTSHPLFQVMFGLRPELDQLEIGDLRISRFQLGNSTVKFDLILGMADTKRGLVASLRYKAGLFEDSTITRLLNELQGLLEAMASHPQRRLSELPFLKFKGVSSN
jgi:amino acid adenylation domain-containing protein